MLDITSLIWVAGLFLGLVVSDAAYFGDPLQVQISIPAKLANTGFTEVTAEQLFAAEVFNIGQAVSLVPTPRVQISSRPTIASAVAKPLNLDKVVTAVQIQMGADLTTISGSVMVDDKGPQLAMVMVVVVPREAPVQVKLTQDDGDATALIRHAANLALERVAPYRVALTQFGRGLEGDNTGFAEAKGTASRAVKQHFVAIADRASERVMLFNLLGLLAVADADAAEAEAQFRLSDYVRDAAEAAHGTVSLNRAFLAIAAKQPEQAAKWLSTGLKQIEEVKLPGWQEWTLVLSGLTAWSRGELEDAEKLLREATADAVDDDVPYYYLGQFAGGERRCGGGSGSAELGREPSPVFGADTIARIGRFLGGSCERRATAAAVRVLAVCPSRGVGDDQFAGLVRRPGTFADQCGPGGSNIASCCWMVLAISSRACRRSRAATKVSHRSRLDRALPLRCSTIQYAGPSHSML